MHKDNNGLAVLNPHCADLAFKTVVVLGVPRGGTSMIAGAIAKLGVFMGPEFRLEPLYENRELESCAKANNKTEAKKIIADYNEKHPIWGIKILPWGWRFWLFNRAFSRPIYVVVFRDIVATANRRVLSLRKSLLKEMFAVVFHNFCLCLFLMLTKRPALIVSYEKALLFPEEFVAGLASFLNITPADLLSKAIQFIEPSPKSYRVRTDINAKLDIEGNYFGYLDLVNSHKIIGWALSLTDEQPLKIEFSVNGQSKEIMEAVSVREDVQKSNTLFREHCGFEINLNDENKLNAGDCVEVKILGQNIHLTNSPYIVK